MQTDYTHDIIISGGGMVGMALACAAAKYQLNVLVIEQGAPISAPTKPGQFKARVSALNLASERLLRNVGAWQHIEPTRLGSYRDMYVWDGLGQGEIEFNAASVGHSHLGHIVENDVICAALQQAALDYPTLQVVYGDSIRDFSQDANGARVKTEQGLVATAAVLVGSEGKHSPVRRQSDIKLWQWDYQHSAIVTTVRHQRPHQQCAQQVFLDSGPLAFLPLNSGDDTQQVSSIVWSVKREQVAELLALSDADFATALNRAFEDRLGEILSVDPRFCFDLSAQQAQKYFDDRIVVLGDAAHTIHPLAGLGVNLGFLDAATLAEQWYSAKTQQTDLGHEFVMRRYQRQRQAHNLAVAGLMETLKRLFDSQAALPVLIRNRGLQLVNSSNLLKRPLVLGALGEFGTPLPPLCR